MSMFRTFKKRAIDLCFFTIGLNFDFGPSNLKKGTISSLKFREI